MGTALAINNPNGEMVNKDFLSLDPVAMVARATEIATILADIINQRQLFKVINGEKYVVYEGWCIMGNLLGILPREKEVKALPDGSYEAHIELYFLNSGKTITNSSSICGVDETRWGNANRFARRSMAITRASGKAYRIILGWVIVLAGYKPTPADEMTFDVVDSEDTRGQDDSSEPKEIVFLNTTYHERIEARNLGAQWDSKVGSWFCYSNQTELIKRWGPQSEDDNYGDDYGPPPPENPY